MKNIFPFLLFLLLSLQTSANEPQPVVSVAKTVTIFQNGAQVTRTATHQVAADRSELVFKGLSVNIQEKTIQLKAEGAVTIMSVHFQINYLEETAKQDEIKRLEKENETLSDRIARLQNDLNVFKQQESLLTKNQVQIVGVPNNPVKTEDLRELADFQRDRLTEVLTRQYDIAQQLKELEKQADALRKQLATLNAQKNNPSGEIRVIVNAERAVSVGFTLSYYVTPAGWEPVYDVRVKDVGSPVALFQKANLYQQTGEDWRDVKLSLSTGDPSVSGMRPLLNTWRLRYISPYARSQGSGIESRYSVIGSGTPGELRGTVISDDGEPLIGATVVVVGANVGAVTDVNGEFVLKCAMGLTKVQVSYTGFSTAVLTGKLCGQVVQVVLSSSSMQLNEVVVTGLGVQRKQKKEETDEAEEDSGPPVTVIELPTTLLYEIDLPVTLLSDGQLQLVDIEDYELPAQYRYHCVPKLDLNAYLTAQVTGWESMGLLSGEANLFFEGTYLGKTHLEFAGTNDTLEISLGKDKNISVTRTKLKEFSKRQFLSNKKEDSRMFEIAVKNKKPLPVTLILEDQFPISTSKNITVERTETGNAAVDDTTGKLTWTLNLAPAEDKKVKFGYKVKYPKEKLVAVE